MTEFQSHALLYIYNVYGTKTIRGFEQAQTQSGQASDDAGRLDAFDRVQTLSLAEMPETGARELKLRSEKWRTRTGSNCLAISNPDDHRLLFGMLSSLLSDDLVRCIVELGTIEQVLYLRCRGEGRGRNEEAWVVSRLGQPRRLVPDNGETKAEGPRLLKQHTVPCLELPLLMMKGLVIHGSIEESVIRRRYLELVLLFQHVPKTG